MSLGASAVGLGGALRAEHVRAKGSASRAMAATGLVICIIEALGWRAAGDNVIKGWDGVLLWQTLYATGLALPLMVLLAGLTTNRERAAREGGTWARPLKPSTAVVARFIVLAEQAGCFILGLVIPVLGVGAMLGMTDPPVGRIVTLALAMWGLALPMIVFGMWATRTIGLVASVVVALVLQIVGTIQAETASWWFQPWSWPVHAVMPMLHIHANSVPLEPGSPVLAWSPVGPLVASLVLAVVLVAAMALTARPEGAGARRPRKRVKADAPEPVHDVAPSGVLPVGQIVLGRRRPIAAQLLVLKGTGIYPLIAATIVLFAITAVTWDVDHVTGLACWLVIPVGCAVLALLAWNAHRDAWRVLSLRRDPRTLAAQLYLVLALIGLIVCAAASVAGTAVGVLPAHFAGVLVVVTLASLAIDMVIASRFGGGAAIGVALVVMVVSMVFGGEELSKAPTWVLGFYGWPLISGTGSRAATAVAIGLVLAVAGVLGWLRRAVVESRG